MILEALKTKTATSHANVEASPLMAPVSNRSLTITHYTTILEKFYGFFHPLEEIINTLPDIQILIPDYASRRKSTSILQDLAVVAGKPFNPDSILLCKDLPAIHHSSAGLGALYVMEGSTLGGKFISKIIYDTLGLTSENGTAFFSGYGALTGQKWKSFQEALIKYAATPDLENEVVIAADDTFRKLEKWFNV